MACGDYNAARIGLPSEVEARKPPERARRPHTPKARMNVRRRARPLNYALGAERGPWIALWSSGFALAGPAQQ
eukprot:13461597-Alexandrium_andersonii.AAC.1